MREDLLQDISIAQLQEKVERLSQTVVGLAGLSAIDNVIGNGFETLIAQLQPLQDLAPKREPLSDDQNARLEALRASLAQPVWDSSGSLSIPEKRVPFMFENLPDPLSAQDTPSNWNPGQGRQ